MTTSAKHQRLSDRLVSRTGAWITLGALLVVIVALTGLLRGAAAPPDTSTVASTSESARAADILATFPHADRGSVMVVAERTDSARLSNTDIAALQRMVPELDRQTGQKSSPPRVSEDGRAAIIVTPVIVGSDNAATARTVKDLRATVDADTPPSMHLWVTGGPAFGADITSAFDGADVTLLIVTILIVAVLLILTYRSPILWLIPLAIVALADQVAGVVTRAAGSALHLQFDAGIISVLVFGAGTNYALLLISRYREELLTTDDHRAALAAAWRGTAPAILASNVTVVLSLLTLVLAVIPGTHGLGIASAIGLLIALGAVLLALPPALAVCGRRIFWPFVPRPGSAARPGRVWHAIASRVVRRPAAALGIGVVVLTVMASGLLGTKVGLSQMDKFRGGSESAAGLRVLSAHFPAGEAQPIMIVADSAHADRVTKAASDVAGVMGAQVVGRTTDGAWSKIMVTGRYAPGTTQSLDLVKDLREAVHATPGADVAVGGAIAQDADARAGNHRDLLLIAPLVLLVSLIVLWVLLRSVMAPLLLITINLFSAAAAIGAGSWLGHVIFDKPALDLQVPLMSFLFLVALGIDYTIFLVHRARAEARVHGTRDGTVRAVTHTGGVITSAGIVLAGVFAALGVLPLVTLGQLGVIVGLGVIVDTLLVRTVLVPALFALVGDRIWWPRRPARGQTAPAESTDAEHAELVSG